MEQKLIEEDLKSNRLSGNTDKKPGDGKDLMDKFSNKFKQSISEFKGKFSMED